MEQDQLRLDEWKERYASYRAYRTQYLSFLSFTIAACLISSAVAFDSNADASAQGFVVALNLLVLAGMVAAHVVARRSVRKLGDRMDALEKHLGCWTYRTTEVLEQSLVIGLVACLLGAGLAVALLVRIAF